MLFSCPLCHQPLAHINNSFICPQRHQFDVAKEGYVNYRQETEPQYQNHQQPEEISHDETGR